MTCLSHIRCLAGILLGLLFLGFNSLVLAAEPGPVALLLSADEPVYQETAKAFVGEFDRPVRTFNLHGRTREVPRVMEEILAAKPSLILALGARAAYAAKMWTDDAMEIPIIFAQALNWRHFRLTEGRRNIAGIDTVPQPGSELAYLTMIAPKVKRIGLVHSTLTAETAGEIARAAALFGITVEPVLIDDARDFKGTVKKLAQRIDGFIALRDPRIYTLDTLDWLTERCERYGLACLGRTPELARKGILLTVSPGPHEVALQAVSMAESILKGELRPTDIGVSPPLGTQVYLNLKTAGMLGLEISSEALQAATEIIR